MAIQHTTGFWPVAFALLGNAFLTVIKLLSALASGSSVMFSEAIHSFADTLNQGLLMIGLQRSQKKPDAKFEYGYGIERYFWALISAVGIFFVGAGITAYKGVTALSAGAHIEYSPLLFLVLAVSLIVESYTFKRAADAIRRDFPDRTWLERMHLADPSTLAVYLEDAVAVLGVGVAATAIALTYLTSNTLWDAYGSLTIAALLATVAVVLIWKNRAHLVGKPMPEELKREIVELLLNEPIVEKVLDFKSSALGYGVYRIKFEIELNGVALLKGLQRGGALRRQFEAVHGDFEMFKKFYAEYADRIPRIIGKRIDELEGKIKKRFPSVRHIDIEIN